MTENEAIQGFKMDNILLGDNEKGTVERNNLAIKALEEIQKYREIGTPQGFKDAIQSSIDNHIMMKAYKVKLQEYEEIGTVEECRTAVEKMKPKKVANYELGVDKYGSCPNCGTTYQLERNEVINHCSNYGQALHWSE